MSQDRTADVAIVGAGAAGLATAIFTARRNPDRAIVVLDGAKRPGAKILVAGGGRCNVTNAIVTPNDFNGGSRSVIRRILNAFAVEQTVAFFREIGVTLHEEEHGKLFPDTNQARTVLDALLGELNRLGVRLLANRRVLHVDRRDDHFELTTCDGASYRTPPSAPTGATVSSPGREPWVGDANRCDSPEEAGPVPAHRTPPSAPTGAMVSSPGREPWVGDANQRESPEEAGPVPAHGTPPSAPTGAMVSSPGREPWVGDANRCESPEGATEAPRHEPVSASAPQMPLAARKVVLATGGLSLPKAGSDGAGYQIAQALGHSLVPTTPALAPLILDGDFHAPLSGIAQDVEIAIRVEGRRPTRLRGSMLWTHFGVSGPVVLDASRFWHRAMLEGRRVAVSANLLPGHDFTSAEHCLITLASSQPKTSLQNALATLLPARMATAVLDRLAISGRIAMAHLSREARRKLVHALLAWPLPIRDSRGYAYAEVTAGGVPLDEIDPNTMASRKCPGLHLVGEILDVDGRIGGFNFQWAWSTAFVAGAAVM